MKTRDKSYCIGHRAGEHGPRPAGRNLSGNQNHDTPNPEPIVTTSNSSKYSKKLVDTRGLRTCS